MDSQNEPAKTIDPAAEAQKLQDKLFTEFKDSVVKITTETGSTGTGFFVDENTVATNYHVIRGARSVKFQDSSSNSYSLGARVYADPLHDLALLTIHGPKPANIKPLKLASSDVDYTGARLFHLGHPKGEALQILPGVVKETSDELGYLKALQKQASAKHQTRLSNMMKNPDKVPFLSQPLLVIDAPNVAKGSSGAPFLDKDGNVVAVVRKEVPDADDLAYCASNKFLRDLIDRSQGNQPTSGVPESQYFERIGRYENGFENYFGKLRNNPKEAFKDSLPLSLGVTGAVLSTTSIDESLLRRTGFRPNVGLLVAGTALVPLVRNDIAAYCAADTRVSKQKYQLSLAADAAMGTGFALKLASKAMSRAPLGRLGVALGTTGIGGRFGTELFRDKFGVDVPYFNPDGF